VTTPQDIALLDAKKGLKMFEKVGVPILGIVENMAVHVCSNCGHAEHIFGEGGGQRQAEDPCEIPHRFISLRAIPGKVRSGFPSGIA
jgi:Mrp family chromosome partitioning ATPase